jgi:murein DD-endopeptidase MepM/ murein hydrolase activator NlpD
MVLVPVRLAFLLLLASWVVAAPVPAKARARWGVRHQPARVVNGSPVFFRVTTPRPLRSLSGRWLEHELSFSFEPKSKTWYGLGGASLETKPGVYTLEMHGDTVSGQQVTFRQQIRVQRQRYPRIPLTVAGRYTAPDPEQLKVIEHDKQVKADTFKTTSANREWQGAFEPPVKAPISDVFGVQRVFNGAVKSTHQGLDFRVTTGTPIAAINGGTILLAQPLYFEGNCVVIDHGQGLLSLYLHLSEIRVKAGDHVSKGEEIGLSGGTGRATGPHLHLAVRWQGIYLNPEALLSLRLP